MNKKGDLFTILSKKEVIIGALILISIILIYSFVIPYFNQTKFQSNQKQIIDELKGNVNTLTGSIDEVKTSVLLLNQNVAELEKTKANEVSVNAVLLEVYTINSNLEKTNENLETVNKRLTSVEEDIKLIEPNYTQNVDIKDMRTYFNIFNFRLVLNFFVALSLSLFAFEFIKFFGDFFSYGYLTKNYNLKAFIRYRKSKKHDEIRKHQQSNHKQDESTQNK